jgi:amino acid transporter
MRQVSPRFKIPLNALALNSVINALLALINLGSSVALAALMSLPLAGLMISYFLPILLLTIRKLKGEHPRYGPFKLGRWGLPINLVALCFCTYFAFWWVFPTAYPVTSMNMNYAGPIFIALVLLVLVDWFTTGKTRFEVPSGEYNIEMEDYEKDSKRVSTA